MKNDAENVFLTEAVHTARVQDKIDYPAEL